MELPCNSQAKRLHPFADGSGIFQNLPNLVVDEPVVPELLQGDATPAALADAIVALLEKPAQQRAGYARVRAALGPPDALQRNADWVLNTVAESNPVVARALGESRLDETASARAERR